MALSIEPNIHPLFMFASHYPLELLADTKVSIYSTPDVAEHDWSPDSGLTTRQIEPVWRGWANVTGNIDWRARNREWGGEVTGVHAYRVQLLHIDKNELVPRDQWGDPDLRVSFAEGMRVQINDNPTDKRVDGLKLVVRNAMIDTHHWQVTLLCDIETGDTNG
nr:MAG TPA: hypothetical protein [Caudoviricetes sp.]